MSCVYCAPKSRIRIRANADGRPRAPGPIVGRRAVAAAPSVRRAAPRADWPPGSTTQSRAHSHPVVGRFLDDLHVVHVRLADAGRRDLDELGARAQLLDRRAAAVAHRRAQAAHQLMDHRGQHALVRHAALDALRHELLGGALAFGILEIAVRAAFLHRAERAHAAIALVRAALVELDLARRLLGAGEEAAHHHATTRRRRSPWRCRPNSGCRRRRSTGTPARADALDARTGSRKSAARRRRRRCASCRSIPGRCRP